MMDDYHNHLAAFEITARAVVRVVGMAGDIIKAALRAAVEGGGHFTLLNSTTLTKGFWSQEPGPLMDFHNFLKHSDGAT